MYPWVQETSLVSRITAGGQFSALPMAGTRKFSPQESTEHMASYKSLKGLEKSNAEPNSQVKKHRRLTTSSSDGASEIRDDALMTQVRVTRN